MRRRVSSASCTAAARGAACSHLGQRPWRGRPASAGLWAAPRRRARRWRGLMRGSGPWRRRALLVARAASPAGADRRRHAESQLPRVRRSVGPAGRSSEAPAAAAGPCGGPPELRRGGGRPHAPRAAPAARARRRPRQGCACALGSLPGNVACLPPGTFRLAARLRVGGGRPLAHRCCWRTAPPSLPRRAGRRDGGPGHAPPKGHLYRTRHTTGRLRHGAASPPAPTRCCLKRCPK